MSFKIIVDSCGDFPEWLKRDSRLAQVPLEINIDGRLIIDDETFDQQVFLRLVAESPNHPKSACPSPAGYLEAFDCDAEHIYVVTLSAKLSGSYNSALLAKELYLEEQNADAGATNIHIFDSRSASVGETLIALRILALEEAGSTFEEVVAQVEAYIQEQNTYFVLETLEHLRKNGRLSNLKAMVAGVLNIKPIMGSTPEGEICQLDQGRGMERTLEKMVAVMEKRLQEIEGKGQLSTERTLAIAHCNCPKRAEKLAEKVRAAVEVKEIFVVDTGGISSLYAGDGGIIMVV